MWIKPPSTTEQRERWLAIADLVDRYAIRSQAELVAGLKERGIKASSTTIIADLRNLNIDRFNGIYMRVPITEQDELRTALRARMQAVVESIFIEGQIVVLNTNHGSAAWIALVIREMRDHEILSVMTDSGGMNVWLLVAQGKGRSVYGRLMKIWRG